MAEELVRTRSENHATGVLAPFEGQDMVEEATHAHASMRCQAVVVLLRW